MFLFFSFFIFKSFQESFIFKHPKELTDVEVCNDKFLEFTNYEPIDLEGNDYVCFEPKTSWDTYFYAFIVFGRNITITNSTHSILGAFGGSGKRIRIQADELGTRLNFLFIPSYTPTELNIKLWNKQEYSFTTYVVMKEHWKGNFSIEAQSLSNELLSLKGKFVGFYTLYGLNLSINPDNSYFTGNESVREYISTPDIVDRYTQYFSYFYPKEIYEFANSNNRDVYPDGIFKGTLNVHAKMKHEDYYGYVWPNKVIRIDENEIYSDYSLDDYRLDGIHDPLDDICYYDYIEGPEILNYYFEFLNNICIKSFSYKNRYYDSVFVLGGYPRYYNSSSYIDNPYSTIGATNPRVKIESTYSDGLNTTIFFVPSVYNLHGAETHLDQYVVFKNNWSGTINVTYVIKDGKIKTISGKVVNILNSKPVNITIEPHNAYVPSLSSEDLTKDKQEGTTLQYECLIYPEGVHNIKREVPKDGTYTGSATIKIQSNHENNTINRVFKLSNHTLYYESELDDIYLDGIDHFVPDPDAEKKIIIVVVAFMILFIIILICIFNCCCSKKSKDALDNSSSGSELDESVWIVDESYKKKKKKF